MIHATRETHATVQQATGSAPVCRIHRLSHVEHVSDCVIAEEPVTIMVDRVGSFTVMCTPTDINALAVGFLFSEGMICSADEVVEICRKEHLDNVIGIQIQKFSKHEIQRNLVIASSCGMCGVRNIEKMLSGIPPCEQSLTVEEELLFEIVNGLRSRQQLFDLTGAAHAAAIFNDSGQIIAFAEDIGRHNALDKAIGKCLLTEQSVRGCGVALSGRVSLDMVAKAARAGIELIAAVSGVSSYAIAAAKRWNITLCGFVRQERANVYTGPTRVRIDNDGRCIHAE